MPKVSIIIPLHNCESTVRRAITSVKNQTYTDYEIIAVDNNCTDKTISIVEEVAEGLDLNIVKCSQPGIVPALNAGIRAHNGELIARQDGDDFWYPEKLEKQVLFLDSNKDIGVVGTQISIVDVDGNYQSVGTMGNKIIYPASDSEIKTYLLMGQNPICHPSVVFRSELVGLVGGYEKAFPKAEDLHMWLRMIPHTKFANLEDTLIDYTQRHDDDYDARVPLLAAAVYYNLYKRGGLIEGDLPGRQYHWQLDTSAHGNVGS